jgi:hypothetical protein
MIFILAPEESNDSISGLTPIDQSEDGTVWANPEVFWIFHPLPDALVRSEGINVSLPLFRELSIGRTDCQTVPELLNEIFAFPVNVFSLNRKNSYVVLKLPISFLNYSIYIDLFGYSIHFHI